MARKENEGDMMKLKLNVKGMHCKSCEALVEDSLESAKGVKSAEASAKNESITVEFDESIINEKKIKQIIQNEGYEVTK